MSGTLERRLPAAARAHRGILAPGDVLRYRGCRYAVTALSGTRVHLMPAPGEEAEPMVALLPALASAPDFVVLGRTGPAAVPGPAGPMPDWSRLETISQGAAKEARFWERHVVEVDTGLYPDALDGARPRPGYDPAQFTLIDRYRCKAAELNAVLDWDVSWQTVQRKRLAYRRDGIWGLVDKRRTRTHSLLGRTDPRVADLLQERVQRQQKLGTDITAEKLFTDLRRMVRHRLGEQAKVPANPTLYKLLVRLGYDARHLGDANRGRTGRPGRPPTPFTVTAANAPGELVQIDSTSLDVKVLGDDGRPVQVELTAAIDVHTRSIIAAVLRARSLRGSRSRRSRRRALVDAQPTTGRSTKAVDASLLLAEALVPTPMRPGYRAEAGADHSDLPYAELAQIDERFAAATARPVIVPDLIVIDHGSVFATRTFMDACAFMGISVRPARKRTPTDKAIIERTFAAIKSMFSQHINSYTGRTFSRRSGGIDPDRLWTLQELNDLLQQWIAMGWQNHPHEELRDPRNPSAPPLTPNQMYAVAVQAAGYLPIPLGADEYLRLLPTAWVGVGDQGIRFRHRTYDSPGRELEFCRSTPSGLRGRHKDRWEIRYNPYTPERIWLHDHTGQGPQEWVEAVFTRQHLLDAPWTEYWWQLAAGEFAERGGRRDDEDGVSQVLREMMERAGRGPDEPGTVLLPDGYGPAMPGHTPQPFDPYADAPPVDLDTLGPLTALDDDASLYAPQPQPNVPQSPSPDGWADAAPRPPDLPRPDTAGEPAPETAGIAQSWWAGLPPLDELGTDDPGDDDAFGRWATHPPDAPPPPGQAPVPSDTPPAPETP